MLVGNNVIVLTWLKGNGRIMFLDCPILGKLGPDRCRHADEHLHPNLHQRPISLLPGSFRVTMVTIYHNHWGHPLLRENWKTKTQYTDVNTETTSQKWDATL